MNEKMQKCQGFIFVKKIFIYRYIICMSVPAIQVLSDTSPGALLLRR